MDATQGARPSSRSAAATPAPPTPTATPTAAELTRVIALDGPAGSGKSTVARRVAAALGWRFVDTGAGYRAAALAVLRAEVQLTDSDAIVAAVRGASIQLGTSSEQPCVMLNGEDVSAEIRTARVTDNVSSVSAIPEVRAQLVQLQRAAMGREGAVVEGRDIATVVAPHARLKVYLDARPDVRAARRAAEAPTVAPTDAPARHQFAVPGPAPQAGEAQTEQSIRSRDERDHQTTPLEVSDGALHLDTSDMSLDEVVDAVVRLAHEAGLAASTPGPAPTPAPQAPTSAALSSAAPTAATRWVRATGQRKPWLVAASRPFGQCLFRTLFRVRVVGAEHVPANGPLLIAGNHTGFLDGPMAYAFSPRSATFIAKSELFVGPLARALGWLGQIPVHRGRPDRTALRTGLRVLQGGAALGVFPEGTRGSGQLAAVSDGVAYLALRSGAAIVPLAVIGTSEAMPKGAKLPRWRAPVTLVFGSPFTVHIDGDPRARRTVRAAGEQIRLQLVAHLRAAQANVEPTSRRIAPGPSAGDDDATRSDLPA